LAEHKKDDGKLRHPSDGKHPSMNQFFDNQAEPQTDGPKKMSYGQKVFDMVKGINVEFGKKKKEEEDGPKKPRKKR